MTWAMPSNNGDVVGFIQYVNTSLAGGMWGIAMIFVVFVVAFLALSQYFKEEALMASSFIAFIMSVAFRALNLINDKWVFLWLLILVISLLLLHKQNR